MAKRKASEDLGALQGGGGAPAAAVKITPLGAGQEVGRSCIILEYM
jgi:predicted metal-dependent RNase